MDEQMRGAFVGLTLAHGQDDLIFAAREGVAFALRTCVEVLAELGVPMDPVIVTGGFSADPDFLQLLANVLNKPLLPAAERDASGYGAALMGAVSVGALPLPADPVARGEFVHPDDMQATRHNNRYADYQKLRSFSQRLSREL
jgi:xylulokinase